MSTADSKSEICNLALSEIGISSFISNVETDKSLEAIICRRWFDISSKFVQRECEWNFNRRYIPLALVSGDIPNSWTYMYAYPSDCLAVRAILPTPVVIRFPRADQRIPFEILNVGDLIRIGTDQETATARYTHYITNTGLFDPHFVTALSLYLAMKIASPLSAKKEYVKDLREAYMGAINRATMMNFNEGEDGPEPEDEALEYRNA